MAFTNEQMERYSRHIILHAGGFQPAALVGNPLPPMRRIAEGGRHCAGTSLCAVLRAVRWRRFQREAACFAASEGVPPADDRHVDPRFARRRERTRMRSAS